MQNPYLPPSSDLEFKPGNVRGPTNGALRVEYALRFRDYLLFNVVHQFLSVRPQVLYVLLCLLIFDDLREKTSPAAALIGAILLYCSVWLVLLLLYVILLFSRLNKTLLTKHVIEVRNEALYEETRFNKSLHYWPGVVKVVDRPGFVAIYIAAQMAHIIPARAFADDDERSRFVALTREKLKAGATPPQDTDHTVSSA